MDFAYAYAYSPWPIDCPKGLTTVYYGGEPVYTMRLSEPTEVDFAELMQCCAQPIAVPSFATDGIKRIEKEAATAARLFEVKSGPRTLLSVTLLEGHGDDVPLFLSARESGGIINVRSSELEPLVVASIDGIYGVDLQRRYLSQGSRFDVETGTESVTVNVLPPRPSLHRCVMRFRNHLGGYDRLELLGQPQAKAVFPEDTDFRQKEGHRWETRRPPLETRFDITVDTGPKEPWEMRLLLQALTSQEVWLIGIASRPVRVIPNAEGLTLSANAAKPQSATLRLTTAATYRQFAADPFGNIFTDQFTEQFT